MALQGPLLGRWRSDFSGQRGGGGWIRVDVVEGCLDERVHHQAGGPDAHSYADFTVLFCFEGEAAAVVVWID